MSECLPDFPRYVRERDNEWEGADHPDGPWRLIPAPQSGLPWEPSRRGSNPPPPASPPTADRLALAMCKFSGECEAACPWCRQASAKVARELAAILRERHGGSSTTADWLDGVGTHP